MAEGFSYPIASLGDYRELERNKTGFESLAERLESEFKKDFLVACKTGTKASYALIYSLDQNSKGQEFARWYRQNYEIDQEFTDLTSQALTSIGSKAGLSTPKRGDQVDLIIGGAHGYQAYRAFDDNSPEPEYLSKEYFKHIVADEEITLDSVENYTLKDVISRI